MAREFVADHVGLDTKVPSTLRAMLTRPGLLTAEYLSGHRVRWVAPLKLYLFASLVYFLLLSLPFLGRLDTTVKLSDEDRAELGIAIADSAIPVENSAAPGDTTDALERFVADRATRFNRMSELERAAYFKSAFVRYMPNAVFLLLPVFAGILHLLYRKTGRFYAEHLIFALHVHAFAFVALIPMLFLPDVLDVVVPLWLMAYLYLAMRRVYGDSRGRTLKKFAGLFFPYMAVLQVVTLGVLGVIFAFG
jgi:hypothetical protein